MGKRFHRGLVSDSVCIHRLQEIVWEWIPNRFDKIIGSLLLDPMGV